MEDCKDCASIKSETKCKQCKKTDMRIFFSKPLEEYWKSRTEFHINEVIADDKRRE